MRKFILATSTGGSQQFVTVDEADLPRIRADFGQSEVLTLVDADSGQETLCNMGNIAFLVIKDHRNQS